MKNLITAALIAMTATSAMANDTAINFAECVATRVAAENGVTLEESRALVPAATREAEINIAIMASKYLALPANVKSQGLVMILTKIPQSAACLHILES